jgi:trehalose synthase
MKMEQNLNDYRHIVGEQVIKKIQAKANKLKKKHIVCISSTHQGGGVAEMLNSYIPLLNEIGLDIGWRIIHGSPDFFNITKKFHNGLQSGKVKLNKREKEFYLKTNRRFSSFTHLNHDLVLVHDPQPLALIKFYKKKQPWLLRLHIDLTNPNPEIWNFLKPYINMYDHIIISDKKYNRRFARPFSIFYPAIDPRSPKNKYLKKQTIEVKLDKLGIPLDKPIITQISRYDKWKDPEGVVKVFEMVKKEVDCHLVLLGNLASDDPEGVPIYNKIHDKYGERKDISILVNVDDNDIVVNALQRRADVVIQKSTKEGFGLTVTEALYKKTPVVGSKIGGIPHQVIDGHNGYLHDPKDYKGFSRSIVSLLKDDELRQRLGKNAHEHVVNNFLITRLMLDWLSLFEKYTA